MPDASAQLESALLAFDEGNELYRAGDYQAAVEAYEKAVEGGYASGALFYNMGNAYFRMDELGQAIRYYEKARLLIPESAELLHNLEFSQSQTVDQFSKLPVPVWVTWWQTTTARTGGRWLFWLGMLFYLLAVSLIVYRIRTGLRSPWLRRARAVAILFGIVLLAGAFSASVQSTELKRAVILANRIDLHEAPDAGSSTELAIHEGLVVDILQQSEGWIEVRLPNGAHGWVPAESAGEI